MGVFPRLKNFRYIERLSSYKPNQIIYRSIAATVLLMSLSVSAQSESQGKTFRDCAECPEIGPLVERYPSRERAREPGARQLERGSVGAGCGATTVNFKGGIGSASNGPTRKW